MASNFFYTCFFGLLNFSLFCFLIKSLKIEKKYLLFTVPIIIIVTLLNTNLFTYESLKSSGYYFDLLLFSIILIPLHYFFDVLAYILRKRRSKFSETTHKLQDTLIRDLLFLRSWPIYLLAYINQILVIWQ